MATYGGINGARAAVKRVCVPWVNNNRRGNIYRRGHAARSDRSCNFGCISGTKVFYDKPHVYFEDSSIQCTKRGSVRCLTQPFLRFRWDRQTHTQNDYCNPRCACAPRVNKVGEFGTLSLSLLLPTLQVAGCSSSPFLTTMLTQREASPFLTTMLTQREASPFLTTVLTQREVQLPMPH